MVAGDADAVGDGPGLDPLVGTLVGGRFQVIDRIARGGMSSVYFATQVPLNRPVAIKVLRGAQSGDAESVEGFRRRFLQEASILSQLQHPNIVTLIEYGQISQLADKPYFMAMEYLRGETLAQRFRSRGRLPIQECIRMARQIGRGLREAHRRGFVHRDLKPSNIMLVPEDDRNDIVKLVDFGIGKIVSGLLAERDVEDQTRVGLLLGSPRHMAPEQIRCEPVEVRTDLYGLGVILFQALTGQLPFDGRTEVDVLMAHCSLPPPLLHEMCPGQFYPDSLAELVRALLQKHPSGRPTIDEFLLSLSGIEEELFGYVGVAGPTLQSVIPSISAAAPPQDFGWDRNTGVTQAEWKPLQSGGLISPSPGASIPPHAYATDRRRKRGRRAALLGLLALAGVVGFTLLHLGALREPRVETTQRSLEPKVHASVAPVPAVSAEEKPPVASFVLTIGSTPTSATVSEGGVLLGVTPLALAVQRDSLRSGVRRFVLEREGFAPYTVEQGDSAANVSVSATLLGLTRKAQRSRVSRAGVNPAGSAAFIAGEAFSGKRSDGVVLDIRPRR